MLRRRSGRWLIGLMLVTFGVVVTPEAARADYIQCPPVSGPCILIAEDGGGGGGGGGGDGEGSGSGSYRCLHEQLGYISCYKQDIGWFNPTDACFYQRTDDPLGDPLPAGSHQYVVYCYYGAAGGWLVERVEVLASPPNGYGADYADPIAVATMAINLMGLKGPNFGRAPRANTAGLVGLPVWLWVAGALDGSYQESTWGSITRTATAGAVSVTATGTAQSVTWDMGDGTRLTCSPGIPYRSEWGADRQPDGCVHVYVQPPASGSYRVTAITTWSVVWAGGGRNGVLTLTRQSTSDIEIDELQVVNG